MSLSETLIARARDIAPMAEKEACNTDRNRKLSDAVIDACCDAGLMEILVPKMYGGHELDYATMAAVVYEFGRYCTSTAWVLSFYIGHNYIHALWPKQFQDEVFADRPFSLTPGTIAPNFRLNPVDGGYIASGLSQWNSGSSRSDWFLNSGLVMVDGKPQGAMAFMVPASDVEIIDNWDMAGMRGTASGDARLNDVFVPRHRAVEVADLLNGQSPGAKIHDNRIYSLPILPFVLGETLPVMAGAYRGAADAFKQLTMDRYSTFTSAKVQDKQTAQIRIGHGQAGAAIAETLLQDYARFLDTVDPAEIRPIEKRAEIRARMGMIADYVYRGINELMLGAGGGAYRNTSPLQRFLRDMNVLRVHGFLDVETAAENLGRVQLGLEPNCPL
ncbi:acyl-CoA dehydrogenase family protein [Tsuneonella sp. CC-YZS046]|uniref:acyl-CoA dehydrogenase family protein n=1 Tax=Tsuneonella sp. CC-YZS046 TaxID=3042152 RepID=UPI002D76F6EA|nr:acyl-CoA dehydrogenase family protein [Tsuneonella sp. CC-YZS046]WRO67189.1 acyl-CoA dehydrogenase family protein [Tsuneonella sp. CC-YZS046]